MNNRGLGKMDNSFKNTQTEQGSDTWEARLQCDIGTFGSFNKCATS